MGFYALQACKFVKLLMILLALLGQVQATYRLKVFENRVLT